jgi:hypothetical protein
MKLTVENVSTQTRNCRNPNLSTVIPAWTGPEINSALGSEKPATDRPPVLTFEGLLSDVKVHTAPHSKHTDQIT